MRACTVAAWASIALVLPSLAAGQERWRTDFTQHSVPLEEIVSGGPPKDGIPAIDNPSFVSVDDADDWLEDREPVVVVREGEDVRLYPYQILIYHEIVNDIVGDRPVSITYCPLCNTALVFDGRLGNRLLDFGTTGRLRHSDLVMYDRQTESWWQQATGEAIVGTLTGERLRMVAAQTLSWEVARETYAGARVLSKDTGHDRPYGRNPYTGYDTGEGPIERFFRKTLDNRLPPMERVAALTTADPPVAYPFSTLSQERVIHDEVGGREIVVFWTPGTASALDRGRIAEGRDVGASGVFRATLDGRTLTFEPERGDQFRDRETGSEWSVAGYAISGPLQGRQLEAVPHGDYLWFAWAAFKPETDIRR